MASLRDIKKRIVSVQSTKQITRTMEMVATAKIRHATARIEMATPYAEAMNKILAGLAKNSGSIDHPLLKEHDAKKTCLAVVVVSDRGLAGGFNSSVLREAEKYVNANKVEGIETKVVVCGKKGVSYFNYRQIEPVLVYRDMSADPTLGQAREISTYARTEFLNGNVDEVVVFYNHARNAADQDLREELVLPISAEALAATEVEAEEHAIQASPEFEPSAEAVLDSLLPAYVETAIYHALIDSAAAEQGARRKAMKSATDNATAMVASLDLLYNRIRQSAITTEITEIVGGAAALED